MEPGGSLPHSQEPATCPYPEPAQFSPCPPSHVLKIHFNIIRPSTPGSPKWLQKESYIFFSAEGPRSRRYGRTAALRLLVQPGDEDDSDDYFLSLGNSGAPMEWNWQGKTEVLGEKPVPVQFCPP
jgi:hypothetical protein